MVYFHVSTDIHNLFPQMDKYTCAVDDSTLLLYHIGRSAVPIIGPLKSSFVKKASLSVPLAHPSSDPVLISPAC